MAIAASGVWPHTRLSALDWLINETVTQPFVDNLFAEFSRRMRTDGVRLDRATLNVRTLHPQFSGASVVWRADQPEHELIMRDRDSIAGAGYLNSPIKAIHDGAGALRQRLDVNEPLPFPIHEDLRTQGYTDYLAVPLITTDNRRHVASFCTKTPGGFANDELYALDEVMPALAMAIEIRLNRRVAKNVLQTYVGKYAGERILAGEIDRGSGMNINAAIWNCDLRGFTVLSDTYPRNVVLDSLNEYFDCMAAPVEAHGGEILKFIGDAMLAVFPLQDESACTRAAIAAGEARAGMRVVNQRRREVSLPELAFGLALHVGEVTYGNIGSQSRLDFTVIGPAVNVASRLEGLCKVLGEPILMSGEFVGMCRETDRMRSLGRHHLRGVERDIEVFALVDDA